MKEEQKDDIESLSFVHILITPRYFQVLLHSRSNFNIYDFNTENFKDLPSLKVLDLSDNNISSYIFFDSIKNKYRKTY